MAPQLDGFAVGVTADRRWEEQAELLQRRGITVVHGPAIRTLPLISDPRLLAATEELIAHPPDIVVANTAIGVRAWLSEVESHGRGDALVAALRQARIVARGPKAAGAVHAAGLDVAWRAPTETLAELRDRLLTGGVAGARVAFQRDGADGSEGGGLADELRDAGAEVVEIPVYRWQLPEDVRPALRLVEAAIEARLHAVTFTSGPAVRNLLAIAAAEQLDGALLAAFAGPVTAVCVGPVCAATARRHGIERTVTPSRARLGPMIRALGEELEARVEELQVDGRPVAVRGSAVVTPAGQVGLAAREVQLLRALAERPGVVVSKGELLARVWGPGTGDPHLVEVTVARLRRRLEPVGVAVATVPRRGYRLTGAPQGVAGSGGSGDTDDADDAEDADDVEDDLGAAGEAVAEVGCGAMVGAGPRASRERSP
ncbi:MAG TPA: uroporphyrinogen-III synthase [Acidimicrobiales bacterium]